MKTTEQRKTGELDKLIHGDLAKLADRAIAGGRMNRHSEIVAQEETDDCQTEDPVLCGG